MSDLTTEEYKNEVYAVKEELEDETPAPTVEETPSEPTETPSEPSKDADPITTPQEQKEDETPKQNKEENIKHLEDLIGNLKSEIEALKNYNNELQDKVKDLGKQPSAKPVNVNGKPNAGDTYSNWRNTMAQYLGY